jgi:peptidoglycan hydrolase-like protein with peptidoglycan-binding domain
MPPVAVAEVSRPIQQHVALQRDLAELGFAPPGAAIDGVYGPVTRSAILGGNGRGGMWRPLSSPMMRQGS